MKFPDKLTLTARNRTTGGPVNNVAFVLVLFAPRKNDYYVGPVIADPHGRVEFTRDDCEAAIKRAQEMFVMDYSGDLESCRPFIEVRLHPPEQIQSMLRQYRQSPDFWGKAFANPRQLFAELETVKNADYEQAGIRATEEELRINPQLELPLVRRAV